MPRARPPCWVSAPKANKKMQGFFLSCAWHVLRLQKTRLERIGVSTSQRLSVFVLSVLTSWTRLVLERLDVLERIDVLADSPSKNQELSSSSATFS